MSKYKDKTDLGAAPKHIEEWAAANPFSAADDFADQVRQDARGDVAIGRPIEDARLLARGLAHDEGSRKERSSRWPMLDAWIEAKLRERSYTNDQLFELLPGSFDGHDFYAEGGVIVSEGKKEPLRRSGFNKRVGKVKTKIAKTR